MRRDVDLVVRARTEGERALNNLVDALEGLTTAQGSLKSSANGTSRDLASLVAALAAFDRASKQASGTSDKVGQAYDRQADKLRKLKAELSGIDGQLSGSNRALSDIKGAAAATGQDADAGKVKAIEAAQKQLVASQRRLTKEIEAGEASLHNLASEYQRVASLANAFDALEPQVIDAQGQAEAAEALAQTAIAAQQLREKIDPSIGIQRRLNAELAKVRDLHKQGAITAKEMAAAEELLRIEAKAAADELGRIGKGERGRPSLFGLKPYELTNLGYQVNDVFTQLASGTGLMQVMAQQGGQLLQLFPRLGASLVAALTNPAVIAFAATMALIGVAIGEAVSQAERLRTIAGILRANADGARYSAEQISAAQVALDEFGMTAKEATDAVRLFIKEGINPEYFNAFGMAAKNMARVMGGDVKDAAKQVAEAFSAGYDAIVQLDDATNFLSATERKHIRVLFESGRAAEARSEAFRIFERQMDSAADKSKSKWSKAVEHLDDAWGDLKRSMADTAAVEALITLMDKFAGVLERLAALSGDVQSVSSIDAQLAVLQERAEKFQTSLDRGRIWGAARAELEDQLQQIRIEMARLTMERGDLLTKQSAGSGDTVSGDSEAAAKARAERLAELDLEKRVALATSDSARIKIAGEKAYQAEIRKTGDVKTAEAARDQARFLETLGIQRQRRQDLLSTAKSFTGRREGNRQDNAALQALFQAAKINIDPAKVAWCAAFINAILASKGLPTSGSQLASSFKNYGTETKDPEKGDIVVLKPQARGASGHVGLFEGFDPKGNVRVFGGNQGKDGSVNTSTFARKDVVSFRRAPAMGEGAEGLDSQLEAAIKLAESQSDYNRKLDDETASRQLAIKYLREQLSLTAQQSFESQRRQAIEEAITSAERDAAAKQLTLSADRRKAIEESVGAQYDLEHTEQLVNDRLAEQQALRDALRQGIAAAQERGDEETVARLRGELDRTEPVILDAIDAAERFWSAFNTPEAKAALESLRRLRQDVADTGAQLAKAQIDQIGKRIQGASDLRGGLQERVGISQLLGDGAGARQAQQEIEALDASLIAMRESAIQAWVALAGDPAKLASLGMTVEQVQAIIVELRNASVESELFGRRFLATGEQINLMLVDGMANAVDNFFNRIRDGESVLGALWNSLAQFAADFLRDIGMMILKQTLFNALTKNGTNAGGGIGGAIAGAMGSLFSSAAPLTAAGATLSAAGGILSGAAAGIGVSAAALMAAAQMLMVANAMAAGSGGGGGGGGAGGIGSAITLAFGALHTGGIAGAPTMRRNVSPAVFAGAQRFHNGGMPGLRPDEVPTILEKGEEVLTKSDARHRKNLGKGGGGNGAPETLKVVGVFDPAEIPRAMMSSAGERTVMTILGRNKAQLQQLARGK
jgi:uncharacterized protein (TIGR02594 family)